MKRMKKYTPKPVWFLIKKSYQYIRQLSKSDGRYAMLARFNSKIHQTTAVTAIDRYPLAFSTAQKLIETKCSRILSFGCSTGEEVVTLRRYFPQAEIIGAEINKRRLKTCRHEITEPNVTFINSTKKNIRRFGPYTAIFAMAVLQRTPHLVQNEGITDISSIYNFAQFNSQLREFDRNLEIGGLIIIQNTQYRFKDSEVYERYEVCGYADKRLILPSFDVDGRMISNEVYNEIIFRKLG